MSDTLTLPATGTYQVDPVHSSVNFVARHLVGSKVRGRFTDFSGTVVIADPIASSSVTAEVALASVDTGNEQRDGHLRSGDFFDIEAHPTVTLKSTGLEHVDGAEWKLTADLTVRGVTKPVVFDLEYLGAGPGMAPGVEVVAFSASTDIDRRDFGVSFSGTLDNGGLIVGNKVHLELEIEANRQVS